MSLHGPVSITTHLHPLNVAAGNKLFQEEVHLPLENLPIMPWFLVAVDIGAFR